MATPPVAGPPPVPSGVPTQKTIAGALAGAVVTILLFILTAIFPTLDIPEGVVAALTTLIAFAISYYIPPGRNETTTTQNGAVVSARVP